MSSKKYNQGDQLVVTEGQLAGVVGRCVGYGDTGMVKIGFSLGDGGRKSCRVDDTCEECLLGC